MSANTPRKRLKMIGGVCEATTSSPNQRIHRRLEAAPMIGSFRRPHARSWRSAAKALVTPRKVDTRAVQALPVVRIVPQMRGRAARTTAVATAAAAAATSTATVSASDGADVRSRVHRIDWGKKLGRHGHPAYKY